MTHPRWRVELTQTPSRGAAHPGVDSGKLVKPKCSPGATTGHNVRVDALLGSPALCGGLRPAGAFGCEFVCGRLVSDALRRRSDRLRSRLPLQPFFPACSGPRIVP